MSDKANTNHTIPMRTPLQLNRRSYLKKSAMAAAATSIPLLRSAVAQASDRSKQILIFVKPIQELSFAEVAKWLEKWNVGGIEATVRDGGWFGRKEVAAKLPRLMDQLQKVDRSTVILASDINSVEGPDIDEVLLPAAKLGVKYIRMKYFKYNLSKPILPQLDNFIEQAKGLAKLCEELKVIALYQNHAGADYVGAPLWDIAQILDEVASPSMRLAIDTRHTPLEATEAWKINVARAQGLIGSIFIKDGIVKDGKIVDVGLGKGTAAKPMFNHLWSSRPDVPLCLHMEHIDHRKPELLQSRLDAIAEDLDVLNNWIGAS